MLTTAPSIYHNAYSIAQNLTPTNDDIPPISETTRAKRGVVDNQRLWPQHKTLTIAFMDTSKPISAFLKKYISTYSPYINLKLKFVDGTHGDIRISTSKDILGDWSYIGAGALKIPANQPTMHLNAQVHSSFLAMNVLHEFGHALGLHHEHQHPERSLDFNTLTTYTLYKQRLGIDPETVYENILKKAKPAEITASDYDPKSIMHYNFDESVLWKQPTTGYNPVLSEKDKAFLTTLYPPLPHLTPSQIRAQRYFRKGLV